MTNASSQNQSGRDILQNEVLTTAEVAIYLRVSRVTVWRWCRRGIIPASQLGRNWRIRRDDVLDLLETPQCPTSDPIHLNPTSEDEDRTDTLPVAVLEKEKVIGYTEGDPGDGSGPDERKFEDETVVHSAHQT